MFASAETSFFSLSTNDVKDLKSLETPSAKRVLNLLSAPKHLLSSVWAGNIAARLGIMTIVLYVGNYFIDFSTLSTGNLVIFVLAIVFALVLFADTLPRWFARHYPVVVLAKSSYFLTVLLKGTKSFSPFIASSIARINKLIKNDKLESRSFDSLSNVIESTVVQSSEGKKMLKAILDATDTEVREALCPRVDVTAVEINTDFQEICTIVIESAYSRIPVYEDNFDNIKGILYVKDLLPHIRKETPAFKWQALIREAYFIPENKRINDLLEDFQQKKTHMAIVVDEYGGTVGVITLEDILEEIVGDILDESDLESDESFYVKSKDGAYLFEGKTALNDFYRTLSIQNDLFDDIKGDAETLAGLLLEQIGEFPQPGEQFEIKQFTFTVVEADDRRIVKIKVVNNEA